MVLFFNPKGQGGGGGQKCLGVKEWTEGWLGWDWLVKLYKNFFKEVTYRR